MTDLVASAGPEIEAPGAGAPARAAAERRIRPPRPDHFVERDGAVFAGTHLILDLWGASRLDDMDRIEAALRDAAAAAGATVLHLHLHRFGDGGGVSGVAVLAESHICVHTWPERGYAALDIFMCGAAEPHEAVPILAGAFSPASVEIDDRRRGALP